MSRLTVRTKSQSQTVIEGLYKDLERRIVASPPGLCPVDMAASFLRLCHAQTCGKCVPCRIGLGQLETLLQSVLDGTATEETVNLIEKTARVIKNTADCAIGFEAAEMVLKGVLGFRDDYLEHVRHHRCLGSLNQPVPCVALCPAGVDIPGYIALVRAGRCADAVRLIRKDNPFPVSCGLICEHPCEARCRRNMIDSSVNIRGLKRYATDHAGDVPFPARAERTGKRVAVIGGGPSGLSAACYLALMGHDVKIFEQRKELGGMLRYGIPSYRLPREMLDRDIQSILSIGGIETETGVSIGKDIWLETLQKDYDAVYIAIGAHTDKKLGLEGEDGRGVVSAVEMLRAIGMGHMPDFRGQSVVIVGGGNVAMDCTRSAMRLGASRVTCVYRRRQIDMTALQEEVEGAIAEGCEIVTMEAPVRIELDEHEQVKGLVVQPQITGPIDSSGRPRPMKAGKPERLIPCDRIIVAIGQGVETKEFEDGGIPVRRGRFDALSSGSVENNEGTFAGGDCVSGPATVIRAIGAGKVAAANIDEYLGYHHQITVDVEIPAPVPEDKPAFGRVQMKNREAADRKNDFDLMECGMSREEAMQESGRCLRCDHFGYGVFKGGRERKW
ncbi:NAD(P)-binding protein [Chordicoccus furentiruminis]|uniref:NAD(P)-binding protein n=1 Tax=Chordicoccus furentiruminis TaxID=2709410 RepID=UPI0023A87730|nr:NAD(P)-binding protein [Chordicoccus furentiruminis]